MYDFHCKQCFFLISNNHLPQMFNNQKMQIHLNIQYFKYTISKAFGVTAICINLQSLFANQVFDHKATCTIYTEVSFLTYCRMML